MDEIIQEVKGGKVVKATRLPTQRKGVRIDSMSVVLEFENVMSKRVRMEYLSYDVREFIPAPLRCCVKEWGTLQDNVKENKYVQDVEVNMNMANVVKMQK